MRRAAAALAALAVATGHGTAPRAGAQPPRVRFDSTAARSPDGTLVAFVRDTPGDSVATGLDMAPRTELWVARPDGTGARRLVRGRDAGDMRRVLAGLSNLAFAPDGRTVYAESVAWATSGALHAVDVASGVERFVAPSNGYEVIRRGPLAGQLLVVQHRYYREGEGSYEALVLVSPDGRRERYVGDADADATAATMAAVRAGRVPPARPFPRRAPAR